MADTIQYGMGQIRYSNTSTYMEPIDFNAAPVQVSVSSDENNLDVYQDVLLRPASTNFSFEYGTSYLLRITIPRDLNYNNTYRIKLIGDLNTGAKLNENFPYQNIKYINVPKELEHENSSRVILYPVKLDGKTPGIESNGEYKTKVAIAHIDIDPNLLNNGDVIYDSNNGRYYICQNKKRADQIFNKNDVILNHSWIEEDSISGDTYNLVFSPRTLDETFKNIWIDMLRLNQDSDIYSKGIYGRKIDLESKFFEAKIYKLKNLIDDLEIKTLTHVGVYGHPNLIMAINGEEIRIGQTGYYELNNFDITSLSVAAEDEKDRFTLDYQYHRIN